MFLYFINKSYCKIQVTDKTSKWKYTLERRKTFESTLGMKAHLRTWSTLPLLKSWFQEQKPLLEVFICSSPFQGKQGWLQLAHDLKAVWNCASNPLLPRVPEQLVPSLAATARVGGSPETRGDATRAMGTWPESSLSTHCSTRRSCPGPALPCAAAPDELPVAYFAY